MSQYLEAEAGGSPVADQPVLYSEDMEKEQESLGPWKVERGGKIQNLS